MPLFCHPATKADMMARYKAPSIREIGGLKPYLNSKKADHNGFGYSDFVTMYRAGLNPTAIGKAFGKPATDHDLARPKSASTIKHWITIYMEEQGSNRVESQII